jgi:hypothetical protein
MKILNIGNNQITEYIKLFNSDNINIFNIESVDDNILSNFKNIDIIFINIDTTMNLDGSQNIDTLQYTISKVEKFFNNNIIINTSNVLPNTNKLLNTYYLPFLLDKDYNYSFSDTNDWIFALDDDNTIIKNKLQQLLTNAKLNHIIKSDQLHFLSIKTLELLVYSTQLLITNKISIYNEIYDHCNNNDIDYSTIQNFLNLNPSINNIIDIQSTNKGIQNNLLMKDLLAFYHFDKSNNYIINSIISRNNTKDNISMNWLPIDESFSETGEKNTLQDLSLNKLNIYCNNNNIDTNDCIERTDIITKIINYKKSERFEIPFSNKTIQPQTQTQIQPQTQLPQQTQPQQRIPTQINPIRQQGIPLQLNPPPSNIRPNTPFNMNVRNSNNGMFMNMRPSNTRPGTRQNGSVQFGGGGVQMPR